MIRNQVKLKEVANVSAGNPAPQDQSMFANGKYPFVRTSDVGAVKVGELNNSRDFINEKGINKLKVFPKGSILFPKSGASTFLNHRVILQMDAYVVSHLAVIKANNEYLLDRYLFYFLQTIDAAALVAESAYPSLQIKSILEIDIPIPSLNEQKLIVAKLDAAFSEIDNLICSTSDQIKNTQSLTNLTLNSKIKDLPSSSYKKIGDVCSLVRGPFGGSLKKSIFVEKGFAIYEQAHPINNQCEIFRYFISKEKFDEMRRFEVKPKDILMSCSGVTLGKTTIIPSNAPKGIINQALLKITPSNLLISEYLQIIMRSDFFQKLIWEVSGGAAQPNVAPVKVLKNIAIPIPSIREQEIFINWKQTLDKLELAMIYEQKQNLFIKLKESILSKEMKF